MKEEEEGKGSPGRAKDDQQEDGINEN